jgi:hypothetical protein
MRHRDLSLNAQKSYVRYVGKVQFSELMISRLILVPAALSYAPVVFSTLCMSEGFSLLLWVTLGSLINHILRNAKIWCTASHQRMDYVSCQHPCAPFTFIYIEMNRLALWNASLMAPDIKETI